MGSEPTRLHQVGPPTTAQRAVPFLLLLEAQSEAALSAAQVMPVSQPSQVCSYHMALLLWCTAGLPTVSHNVTRPGQRGHAAQRTRRSGQL